MLSYERVLRRPRNGGARIVYGLSASYRRAVADEEPSLRLYGDIGEGLAYTGLLAGSGGRGFNPNDEGFTMLVDSGTSDNLGLSKRRAVISALRHGVRDDKTMIELKTTVTAGNNKASATATGTIRGCNIDYCRPAILINNISTMKVPAVRRNLFAPNNTRNRGYREYARDGNPSPAKWWQLFASAERTPGGHGYVLIRRASSHLG